MPQMCDMWTLRGKCVGEMVRSGTKIYEPSCCNTCGNQSYSHMNMKQLQTHMHRNSDLMEEHMLRSWMQFERENKVKEIASAKLAAELKAVSDERAKVAVAAADAKKRAYISRLDEIHTKKRLDKAATVIYFGNTLDVLIHTHTVEHSKTKLALLEQLEIYDIEDKIHLLLASGLPALIKNMSKPSPDDDKEMALVRMSAANIVSLWKVAIISTPTIMHRVKQEDLVSTPKDVSSGKKRCANEPNGDRSRLSKKNRDIASGK